MDHRDRRAREGDPRVQRLDRGVVPGLDGAEVDVGDRLAFELQACLDAGEVVGDGDRAQEHRDLDRGAAVLGDRFFIGGLQRRVAGSEVDGLALERGDARARADSLVVDGERRSTAPSPTVRRRGRRTSSRPRRSSPTALLAVVAWCLSCSTYWSFRMRQGPTASIAQPASAPILFLITTSPLAGLSCRGTYGTRLSAFRGVPAASLFNRRRPPCEHFVKAGAGIGIRIRDACG